METRKLFSTTMMKTTTKDHAFVCNDVILGNLEHELLTDLKAYKELGYGRVVHAKAVETLTCSCIYVANALADLYCKCRSMTDARCLFDNIQNPTLVSWNTLLSGYAENGEPFSALKMFSRMKECGYLPDSYTYVGALNACTSLVVNGDNTGCLQLGRGIHSEIRCHLNLSLNNKLIDMYTKCGSMVEAQVVFNSVYKPDVVSWNALLLGYAEHGNSCIVMELFEKMKSSGVKPTHVTYLAVLKACSSPQMLERGRLIHLEIDCQSNHNLQNGLIDMYSKCGSMVEARGVFDNMDKLDVVSWNTLILGYANNGEGDIALDLFYKMKAGGFAPCSTTYHAAIKACTSLAINQDDDVKIDCLLRGVKIHSKIGCHLDHLLQNTLIEMYFHCGSSAEACKVFDSILRPDVVSWTSLLSGYVDAGEGHVPLGLFCRMKESGVAPNSVTYIAVLRACGLVGALALGRKLISDINDFTPRVLTSVIDFFGKCGSMAESREVFDLYPRSRDITMWNALLSGYSKLGESDQVFILFKAMQDQGLRPNAITFVCLLVCCSHIGLVGKAKECFEAMPVQYKITPTVVHYNCMVDAMGRRNMLNEALRTIVDMPCRPDGVVWMTLLSACRKWKNLEIGREAFKALASMDKRGASPYVLMFQICGHEQKDVLGRASIAAE